MPGLNKNRKRPNTVVFRVSNEEKIAIETKIKISGLKKSEFLLNSCFENVLNVVGGKYGSDRLSVQVENMNVLLKKTENVYDKNQKLIADYANQIVEITNNLNKLNEDIKDLQLENLVNQKVILECRFFNEQLLRLMKENK